MRNIIVVALACGTALSALPAFAQDVSGAKDASQKFTTALGSADAATASSFFTGRCRGAAARTRRNQRAPADPAIPGQHEPAR